MAHSELFETGLKVRREVLGSEYVEKAFRNATEFSMPMQELATEYCWGAVWGRPGLEKKVRSLINVAMLSALNRNHELETHVRGALQNGCTPAELQEVFLQVAIYCGVPAGIEGFRIAQGVLDQARQDAKDSGE